MMILFTICNINASDVIMSTSRTYTISSENFYDGGGPASDYLNNQNVVVTLYPSTPGAKVSVTFNSFHTQTRYMEFGNYGKFVDDILYVYNGNSTSANQIGALQGQAGLGTITSTASDGSLTFKFVSHAPYDAPPFGTRSGWSATIATNYAPVDISMIAGGSFTTSGGNFYDAGGPSGDYMDNQSDITPSGGTVVTLYPSTPGAKVSVTFNSFHTQTRYMEFGNYGKFVDDILYVYNGNSTSANQIGALQGQAGLGTITSTASDGSLTFKFVSHAPYDAPPFGTRSGWSATIATNLGVIYPKITLNVAQINSGQKVIITGKDFKSNCTAKITINGPSGFNQEFNISSTVAGGFNYTFASTTAMTSGIYSVYASDNITGLSAPLKQFTLIQTLKNNEYIVTSPSSGQSFRTNQPFNVTFEDLMLINNGNYTYPTVTGNPASRYYSYTIEYQIGAGTPWQTYKTITGFALKNSKISKTIPLTIKDPNNTCQVRVIDNYSKTIISNSSIFQVTGYSSRIKIEMDWDKSFPKLDAPLLGVAADGTARVFLKVSKLDQASSEINSVTVNLEDGTSESTALLGKIQMCIDTDYSLEANDASKLFATDNTADANGKFWFWYVAPDDFMDSTTPFYSSAKYREVNAIIVASKNDGTTEIDTLKIKIVRPPLVMVHGLNGDRDSWDKFQYKDDYGVHKFIDGDNILIWKNPVLLDKKESYINNANKLLDQNDPDNSLQGNIQLMRKLGYACNRVDYVCHSMGGCVMRTAINSLSDKFYSKNSCANSDYKTYNRGFINKAITINTPHDGSPFADLITDVAPHLSSMIELASWVIGSKNRQTLSSFVQRTNIIYWYPMPTILWTTTPAVRDLQVLNGVSFPETFVRNHLIASNVNSQKNICETGYESIDNYVSFMTNVMQKMLDLFPSDKSLRIILKSTENPSQKICAFFDWYTNMKHLDNPLYSGDLVVGLKSQVAGLSLLSLPSNTTVISTPINSNPIDYWHCGILDRLEIGNRVRDLLNSSISSDLFGSSILAKSDMKLAPSLRSKSELIDNSIEIHDTTKVKIELPLRMKTVLIDSTIEIRFHLKDTLNLIYVNMTLQGNQYSSDVSVTNQSYILQVNPDYIDRQQVVITAAYLVNDHIERHIDTLSVLIQTKAPLIGFSASPEVSSISKNQPFYPSYMATYSTFLANIPFNDPQLSVTIDNPLVVSYNSIGRYFEGICDTTSSTFAIVSYKGFKDTIYIEVQVIDTLSSPTTENFSNKENGEINCIDVSVFPNPVSTILNIEVVGESKKMSIEILNIMGQIVFKGIFFKKMEVKASNFSTGIYLIKISDGKSFEYKKFIKDN